MELNARRNSCAACRQCVPRAVSVRRVPWVCSACRKCVLYVCRTGITRACPPLPAHLLPGIVRVPVTNIIYLFNTSCKVYNYRIRIEYKECCNIASYSQWGYSSAQPIYISIYWNKAGVAIEIIVAWLLYHAYAYVSHKHNNISYTTRTSIIYETPLHIPETTVCHTLYYVL